MNRRDFLLLARGRGARSLDLSCEQLYMRYVDARSDGTTAELFAWLELRLRDVETLYLSDARWLSRADLRSALGPLLARLSNQGVRIEDDRA